MVNLPHITRHANWLTGDKFGRDEPADKNHLTECSVARELPTLFLHGHISGAHYRCLKPVGTEIPYMKRLPKLRKPDILLRPILRTQNSPYPAGPLVTEYFRSHSQSPNAPLYKRLFGTIKYARIYFLGSPQNSFLSFRFSFYKCASPWNSWFFPRDFILSSNIVLIVCVDYLRELIVCP